MKIAEVIILIASIITAIGVIIGAMKKIINKVMNPINSKIDKMDERQCKNCLVDFLNDVEEGKPKDEVQIQFAYEVYDHYTKELHCNSYIHSRWEKIMKDQSI